MNNSDIYDGYTSPGADPSERRLTVYLSSSGVKAYLKHTLDATAGYRTLIDSKWTCDPAEVLRHIENAVYDHPEVLDDYECDVLVESDKVMWVPAEIAEDDDIRNTVYTSLYTADPDDIFTDYPDENDNGLASLYYLCPGLPAFLRRTFPGARVTSQQTQLYRRFKGRVSDDASAFADLRNGQMDVLIFNGQNLLMGATHPYSDENDASYHILNCLRQTDTDISKCEIYLSGDRETRTAIIADLRDESNYVRNAMLPRIDSPEGMPTAALICATARRTSDENN